MNTGAPSSAVKIPVCSSSGGTITRPKTSALSIITGEISKTVGSSTRWSGPTSIRAMCGTARPIKAIGPAAAVAAPASSTTAMATQNRVARSDTPSACAASSPNASAFSGRASSKAITTPTTANGNSVERPRNRGQAANPHPSNGICRTPAGKRAKLRELPHRYKPPRRRPRAPFWPASRRSSAPRPRHRPKLRHQARPQRRTRHSPRDE
ncbi:hypothetical protein RSal33209_3348 [Renibacterium salmoninarum ATCC 33209]|uniref:Uncharacterized protein n=1 Tax=Renibacterium salmoninarum (strain ATCC 33209 / DSM 20767 / JCM 11484 / NBRC 15589 / NCIMB 2235) TaxID=288705 RepID=A9WV37_RENSM|nr:hypothetical protein RSal33209_3348 [Renibacterium salmoninarum ATCC 33209]